VLYCFTNIQIIPIHVTIVSLIISSKIIIDNKKTNTIMKINNNSIILGNEQDNLEYKYRKE